MPRKQAAGKLVRRAGQQRFPVAMQSALHSWRMVRASKRIGPSRGLTKMRRLLHFAFLFLLAVPLHATNNYWQRQGTVISHVSTTFYPGQPNVLFEGGSQLGLGAGNVFKMWYENATSPYGIYYAESLDGTTWTQDPSNPIIAAVGGGVKIFKHAGTYYLYGGPNWSGSVIYAYTSTNGVTWTLQNAIALVPSQTWENGGIYQLAVV